VVDFRLQDHIQPDPGPGNVPLLYPGHFKGQDTLWPKQGIKRGNAISLNAETMKWLYPTGFYTVARRFSSKEERRRIVASVVKPEAFPGAPMLGFENHPERVPPGEARVTRESRPWPRGIPERRCR